MTLPSRAIRHCQRCGALRNTRLVLFNYNVSYFYERRCGEMQGALCFPCVTKVFTGYTLVTLFLTWFGMIGFAVGPIYILGNIVEFIIAIFSFARRK
jgi:hypothetical protein